MSDRSQRTANRSALLAIGLVLIYFLIAALGDWEGMEGLALGLMIYFIALLHIPLSIVAVVAAFKSGRHWRNSWIYLYFGTFALVVIAYAARVGEWDRAIGQQIERVSDPETVALRDALQRLKTDPVKAIAAIEAGADVNTRDDYDRTPLMLAANAGHLDLVERLLASGAAVDALAKDGANALHFAAAGGKFRHSDPREFDVNVEVVEALIDAGADPGAATSDGLTPIIGACTAGSAEAVARLLAVGADPNVRGRNGDDCLISAVETGQAEFIRLLLAESGATVDSGAALSHAIFRGKAEVFALLLELGADPAGLIQPAQRHSLAFRLLEDGPTQARMRQALIDSGRASRAFIAGGARELRSVATRDDKPQMLLRLLEMGVDPNATDEHKDSALHFIARRTSGDIGLPNARTLIAAGADIDAIGYSERTPLGVAAHNGQLEMLQFLIAQGADVNYADEHGTNALMLAAQEGYGYIIEALAGAGTDLPAPDQQFRYFSASRKHATGIRALLAFGLDPDQANEHGYLPLFDLIRYGSSEAIIALIEGGARLDVAESRYTPLTAAADRGLENVIEILIDAGMDPNAVDGKARTPIELVIRRRALPAAIALIRKGASVSDKQRERIEERMLGEKFRGRGGERQAELKALL